MEDLTKNPLASDPSAMSLDQLNTLDLTNTDTSYPCLKEGTARFECLDLLLKDNRASTGKILQIKLKLLSEGLEALDGRPVSPGFVHLETLSLVPTDKYDPTINLAKIQLCFLGFQGKINWNDLKGKWGDVRLKVEDGGDEYGKRNRVATWIAKTEKAIAPAM